MTRDHHPLRGFPKTSLWGNWTCACCHGKEQERADAGAKVGVSGDLKEVGLSCLPLMKQVKRDCKKTGGREERLEPTFCGCWDFLLWRCVSMISMNKYAIWFKHIICCMNTWNCVSIQWWDSMMLFDCNHVFVHFTWEMPIMYWCYYASACDTWKGYRTVHARIWDSFLIPPPLCCQLRTRETVSKTFLPPGAFTTTFSSLNAFFVDGKTLILTWQQMIGTACYAWPTAV